MNPPTRKTKDEMRNAHNDSGIRYQVSGFTYDVYLVGVGGQGVLTIGEIIAETAQRRGVPVSR